jgi:hypothetical protein
MLTIPTHAAHSLGGYCLSLCVLRLTADSGAKGLEVGPNLLILTIAIAFKITHQDYAS